MKEITIQGRTLQYQTLWDCSEYGEWCWTEFYEGTVIVKKRKRWWSKKTIEKIIPKKLFSIPADTKDERLSKHSWRVRILHELDLLNRLEQLKNGELI